MGEALITYREVQHKNQGVKQKSKHTINWEGGTERERKK